MIMVNGNINNYHVTLFVGSVHGEFLKFHTSETMFHCSFAVQRIPFNVV